MPRFVRRLPKIDHHTGRVLSKEEFDAKRQAAYEAKTIVKWKSPIRIFRPRSKSYFTKVALYGLLFVLLAIFLKEFFLVGVIISIVFLAYVLATAEPPVTEHRINNMGIVTGEKVYLWEDLSSFWFDKKGDERLLLVQTNLNFPTRLIILLTTVSDRTLLDVLEKHMHYHAAPVHTLFDKWAHTLQKRVNLD